MHIGWSARPTVLWRVALTLPPDVPLFDALKSIIQTEKGAQLVNSNQIAVIDLLYNADYNDDDLLEGLLLNALHA